ncbi:Cro/CI family transcriptional regulator [Candidatus Williamhamiltonella defendens]|uniref:Cro/Cl family transcriptional regulator n=1 Tax=Candidatus Williamhamiltonella defendens TaxID=138072 RepID=A0A2D3TF81_9ENTR|nr:Cro/CI family transcriptional regulator [Candidatus Hamiltonella defensa]ATW34472.1 hypothetical protein BJP43_09635 [Candidatus Hamiltonella defensa]
MYKSLVIAHFGNTVKLSSFLKINSSAISQWGKIIPEKQALKLEKLTEGSLKYDPTLYKKVA